MSPAADTSAFESQRKRLTRLAYRMLGSLAEAEDAVQDAWLRWSRADQAEINDSTAWLVRATTRICLDKLKSARARRETYVGPWLPEPLVEPIAEDPLERAEEVSVAFLLALQRLSPLERAVFLLRDVFDEDYGRVADILGRTEAACRQLSARARAHLKEAKPRFTVSDEEAQRLAGAFMAAVAGGDFAALEGILARDAVMISDGGGKRPAALRPLIGREDVVDFLKAIAWRGKSMAALGQPRFARINGLPGIIVEAPDGVQTFAFEPDDEGRIAAIYVMRNPEKLKRVH
ncbi:MAG TPA: sigma-70 family RNA polymerase sigma factor [Caulobacteraceae bacterium]|nr:sigma-70 family RNA polymerase sigma factor [Caulobacteraceae bacterium]